MNIARSTGRALRIARKKAVEILGEDTVDAMRDIGRDIRSAGDQMTTVAKEVWDDCRDDVIGAGDQVSEFANEVLEDCDNEVLRNARSFYSGVAGKVQSGAYKTDLKRAADRAAERKRRNSIIRRQNRLQRRKLMRKAIIVFVCVIAVVLLTLSAIFWFGNRNKASSRDSQPTEELAAHQLNDVAGDGNMAIESSQQKSTNVK